jgi:hypothetical protein
VTSGENQVTLVCKIKGLVIVSFICLFFKKKKNQTETKLYAVPLMNRTKNLGAGRWASKI